MSDIELMKSNFLALAASRIGVVTGGAPIFRAVADKNALPAPGQARVVENPRAFLANLRVPGPLLLLNFAGERARDLDNGRLATDHRTREMRAIFLLYLVAPSFGVGGDGGSGMDGLLWESYQALDYINLLAGGDEGDAWTAWVGAVQWEDDKPRANAIIYQVTLYADFVRVREPE